MANYRLRILSTLLLILFSTPNICATINYDESVSGDVELSNSFNLDFGNNTFDGIVSFGDILDFDHIIFVLPANSKGTFSFSSELINTGVFIPSGIFTWALEELSSTTGVWCGVICGDQVFAGQKYSTISGLTGGIDINSVYNFSDLPYLNNNIYILHTAGASGHGGVNYNMSYRAQINVQAIPIPPTFILLLSGLVLLSTFRHKP